MQTESQYQEVCEKQGISPIKDKAFTTWLEQFWSVSDFARETACRFLGFTHQLFENRQLMPEPVPVCDDLNALKKALRIYRAQAFLAIACRDLAGDNSCEETLQQLSDTADYLIEQAHQQSQQILKNDIDLAILAMGKLGAHELNFSSDIDLIFVLFKGDEMQATRFGQGIIQVLDQKTADGFVFRVDMRLRPYGDSGPLIMKAPAVLKYYEKQGRDWERYALMKARFVGSKHPEWLKELHEYVYRRYQDYSVRESILEMYHMIQHEQRTKNLASNIKLGPGGIREVEFLCQSIQLTHAGQKLLLRNPSVLKALENMVAESLIKQAEADEIRAAYLFLRSTENRLQMQQDRQTHHLPADEARQAMIAQAMGFESYENFLEQLHLHQASIEQYRESLLDLSELPELPKAEERPVLDEQLQSLLKKFPHIEPLMPAMRQATDNSDLIWEVGRIIGQRKTYFSLLKNEVGQLSQLFNLLERCPYIRREIAAFPRLLGLLLDQNPIDPWPRDQLQKDLQERIARRDDPELYLEALRNHKLSQTCRIAIADLEDRYPIMRVSDFLTELAEVTVIEAEQLAWADMTAKYGLPAGATADDHAFCIVAYGKLGGLELSYTSDLDLVFLYQHSEGETDGERVISNREFYAKLAQRLLFYLQTRTLSGSLYEIDNRLRPEGSKGLLVSQIDAFERYQNDRAWTWEHQSLVRARAISGSPKLKAKFDSIRQSVLSKLCDEVQLKKDVAGMRETMRQNLWKKGRLIHLKQVPGGIVDIEFICQYLALRDSHLHPELIVWSDNIRILEACEKTGVMPAETAQQLCEIYRNYRYALHRQTIEGREDHLDINAFEDERQVVLGVWKELLEKNG